MKTQISQLNKGLTFHLSLDEKSGLRDLVSNVVGTGTNVYNVLDKHGNGRREMIYDGGSYNYTLTPTLAAFGTGNFSIVMRVQSPTSFTQAFKGLFSSIPADYSIRFMSSTNSMVFVLSNTDASIYQQILFPILFTKINNTNFHNIAVTIDRLGNACAYCDGVLTDTVLITFSSSIALTPTQYKLASDPAGFHTGSISMCRIFNYALSASDVTYYSKPENPIRNAEKGSGSNKNILDLNVEGMTSTYWYDKTNSLTATNSGAVLSVPSTSNLGAMLFKGTDTSNITHTFPAFGTGDFTFSIWVYKVSSTYQLLLTSSNSYGFICSINASNQIVITPKGQASVGTSTNAITFGVWNYITYIRKSGVGSFYINKVFSNSITDATNYTASTQIASTVALDTYTAYEGNMKDIMMYNRALGIDEIILQNDSN